MKKLILFCTHHFSGSEVIINSLNSTLKVQCYTHNQNFMIDNPIVLSQIASYDHKCKNIKALYLHEIKQNYQISTKDSFKYSKFIIFTREPIYVINSMINKNKFNFDYASKYYLYRLQRLYQITKSTSDCIFVTYENLEKNLNLLENFLELNEKLEINQSEYDLSNLGQMDRIDYKEKKILLEKYERYCYLLKKSTFST